MFRTPSLEITDFYNPVLFPNLPYDKVVCERLCVSNYWTNVTNCSCLMYAEAYKYSGAGESGWTLCDVFSSDESNLCTLSNAVHGTPSKVLSDCECFEKCDDTVEIPKKICS